MADYTSQNTFRENSTLRDLLMSGRELQQCVKKEEIDIHNNFGHVTNELNTFTFDKELYLKEVKRDSALKNEEDIQQYDNGTYSVNYEDFQLTNEEIFIKQELSDINGYVVKAHKVIN